MSDQAEVFSLTWHQAMCSELCGWEGSRTADPALAKREAVEHNHSAHGIARPAPAGGWKWECPELGCAWRVISWTSEEVIAERRATHQTEHEAAWAAGLGTHRGHQLRDVDGGMGECSCGEWVPLS